MKTIYMVVVCLFCFCGFAVAARGPAEKILGYQPTKKGIIFQVTSGGCTHKEDFVNEVVRVPGAVVVKVTLIRERPDDCYPFLPMGVRFLFTFKELGMTSEEPFVIENQNGIVRGWIWDEL